MFGYATTETDNLMPAPISYAHKLVKQQADVRRAGILSWLGLGCHEPADFSLPRWQTSSC